MEFIYDSQILSTTSMLSVSVADIRDLIQAFEIEDDDQKVQELQLVLDCISRRNRLPSGAIGVRDIDNSPA